MAMKKKKGYEEGKEVMGDDNNGVGQLFCVVFVFLFEEQVDVRRPLPQRDDFFALLCVCWNHIFSICIRKRRHCQILMLALHILALFSK